MAQRSPFALTMNSPLNEFEYEHILEKFGFGKAQWMLLLISGLLTLTSLCSTTSFAIIAIASQCEFAMTQVEKGIMMAACVAGIFLSTYFWGYVSDALGRRAVLLYSTFITNALQIVSMFVTNIWLFIGINFVLGLSLGGLSAAVYPYLSEFNSAKHRAVVINYSSMFVSIAAVYMPATAWWVLSYDWSITIIDDFIFRPWRLIILLNLLPGFIAALILLTFPESPKLLLAQDKNVEARAAVEWIAQYNTGQSVADIVLQPNYSLKSESAGVETLMNTGGICGILVAIWRATVPLFHKPHALHFSISAVAIFAMFFSYSGIQFWYPEIVNRSTDGANGETKIVCDILDASFAQQNVNSTVDMSAACNDSISDETYVQNIIVGLAFLFGFAIQGVLLGPLGRKNVILLTLAISAISGLCLHFITDTTIVLILFCLYILMPGLAISVMLGAVVDLVPTQLRGKAVSICLVVGRLGIILSANLIGVMLEAYCNTTFLIFTIAMIVSGILVHSLPI